ncbi:acyl carrier protein [Bacillus cereus]
MVSDISGVQKRDILTDVDLDEYGFDSITLTELSNNLNQMLDIHVTPAVFLRYLKLLLKICVNTCMKNIQVNLILIIEKMILNQSMLIVNKNLLIQNPNLL